MVQSPVDEVRLRMEAESIPPAEKRPAILIVDDDEGSSLGLAEWLSDLGADVVRASSGHKALRLILQRDFAVILLDVRMPTMDGYETAALIREREKSRRIPLIFLTAIDKDQAHVFRGYSAGAVDYVFKPIEPVIVRAKVAAFIELYGQAEEIRRKAEHERRLLEENIQIRADKMEAEQQLRSTEARQALVIRSMPIALYETEIADGGLVRKFIDENVRRLLGFEASAFTDDTSLWASRVHPDDWAPVLGVLNRIPEVTDYAVEYRWKCADGSYRYFLDQGVMSPAVDGTPPTLFGTMYDVHDQRTLQQQLAHAQKMDAIGQLTGGIAHDFSNMLMVIIGNLDRVRKIGGIEESKGKLLDLALQGAMHCRDMTKRLMAFAREQALAPQRVDLNDVINGLTDLLNRTLGEKIAIEKNLAKTLWPVRTDPTQIEAALVNLIMNARDAMPNGGQVAFRTANFDFKSDPSVRSELAPGKYTVLEVKDTGSGMTKEVLARAMEPFFTTKEAGRGTGLGLATTYGFIKQSGGDLRIESEVKKGTTVSIYLPCDEQMEAGPRRRPRGERDQSPKARDNEVVLLVEDESEVRRTIAGMLRDLGYFVVEAETGTDGLRALEQAERVDLLLTDVVMPGTMNGYQLAQEARRLRPGLKILYTSAHIANRLTDIAGSKLQPLIRKPYRDHELAQAVRDALR